MLSEIPYLLVLYWIIGRIDYKLALAYLLPPFILLDSKIISQYRYSFSIQYHHASYLYS